jgi:HEAT repeat protein
MSADNDHAAKYRNDPRSTEELLGLALTRDADRDEEGYWQPIAALQHRLPRILERVREVSSSSDEKSRATAATILGQGWVGTKFAPELCVELLLRMLAEERATSVLTSIIFALGHFHDPRAVEPLVRLQSHSEACVRHAVVSSLCGCEEEQAIAALVERSADEGRDVRNWATFGLGSQIDTDTPAIREALFARLEETDDEIRGEAIVGLARRGDIRVAAALLKEFDAHETDVLSDWILINEAAEAIVTHANASGAKEWQPILARLAALGIGRQDEIQSAMNRCASSTQ